MNIEMLKRALASRCASGSFGLKEGRWRTGAYGPCAELQAVHLAIGPRSSGEISTSLRVAVERLGSANLKAVLMKARESLQTAISW